MCKRKREYEKRLFPSGSQNEAKEHLWSRFNVKQSERERERELKKGRGKDRAVIGT
jgi:hypothetical protein